MMISLEHCLICGGGEFGVLYRSTFSGTARDAAPYFLANRSAVAHGQIVRCESCGFVFTNPQFRPEEYEEIYERAAASTVAGEGPVMDASARYARLSRIVRQYVPAGGKLLDFGCGNGGLLNSFPEWSRTGFDVGPASDRTIDGKRVITGNFFASLGKDPFLPDHFDLVTAIDVLEHLPDLDRYVAALQRIIAPGGVLVVTVPDISTWLARLTGRKWNMILLEHLWYFSGDTLGRLMDRHGFAPMGSKKIPYDVTFAHFIRRLSQTYLGSTTRIPDILGRIILPIPAGLRFAAFRKPQ
jgi:SAM-dependent methyltransferase